MVAKKAASTPNIMNPTDLLSWYAGEEVPDPITFITSEEWLNRNDLYPRQGTLIKLIFLRDDLFTEYDHEVIAEWMQSFKATGNNGIQPDIYERIAWCKANGYLWFREVLAVMGRRGGKGYVGALCSAYVLWNYLAKGDPQGFYGVDRSKKLTCLVFAGKRDQAKQNLWRDIVNVITEAPCFTKYISRVQAESLTVYAPNDFVKIKQQEARGVTSDLDMASFEILPKESTLMAGRGPASFMIHFDEMAHVVAAGSNRSAEEVYSTSTPSLDQFGRDGFIYEPSSPWQMMGQFYENYTHALVRDPVEWDEEGNVTKSEAAYPNILMVQLASWDIYKDWEDAHLIPMYPVEYVTDEDGSAITYSLKKGAVQAYDLEMQQVERSNPDTFRVERRSQFATALDAYLNPQKVDAVFVGTWLDRELIQQTKGHLIVTYKAHGDPALVNDKFGFAIAHAEPDPDTGILHCVFDLIHHWDPADFENHTLDYIHVEKDIWGLVQAFMPDELTFDQWNSASTIQKLQMQVRQAQFPKRVTVFEKTATRDYNFKRCETFKAAINMGWVHAPRIGTDMSVDLAANELKFLQFINGKVDHPTMGPVQSKDVADAMMECVMTLIGQQVNNFLANSLGNMRPRGATQGGFDPFPAMRTLGDDERGLSGFRATRAGVGVAKERRMSRSFDGRTGRPRRNVHNPFGDPNSRN